MKKLCALVMATLIGLTLFVATPSPAAPQAVGIGTEVSGPISPAGKAAQKAAKADLIKRGLIDQNGKNLIKPSGLMPSGPYPRLECAFVGQCGRIYNARGVGVGYGPSWGPPMFSWTSILKQGQASTEFGWPDVALVFVGQGYCIEAMEDWEADFGAEYWGPGFHYVDTNQIWLVMNVFKTKPSNCHY